MKIDGLALELSRLSMGISRDEMAQILEVSPRTVANWENNGIPSHRETLVRSKLGPTFGAALGEAEKVRYFETPQGKLVQQKLIDQAAEDYEREKEIDIGNALRSASLEQLLSEIRFRFWRLENKDAQ